MIAPTETEVRQQYRDYCVGQMEAEVIEAINDEAQLESENDFICEEAWGSRVSNGGSFEYVAFDVIKVTLTGFSMLGFYVENPTSFYGSLDGHGWKAKVRTHKRTRRTLTLILEVEARE